MANVLPSTIGGDALRVSRLSRDNGESPDQLRLGGARTAHRVAGAAGHHARRRSPSTRACATSAGPPRWPSAWPPARSSLLVVVLVLTARPAHRAPLAHNEGWRRFTGAVRFGLRQLVHDPAAAAACSPPGFAYQLVLVVAALMAAQALGMPTAAGPTALLAFVPGRAHRPGAADHASPARRPRGAVRAVPAPARRAPQPGHRARPAALPAEPRW